MLYVGAGASLVAFDAGGCGTATCTPLTTKALGANASGPVAIVNGRVVVPTASAVQTFALPPATGT